MLFLNYIFMLSSNMMLHLKSGRSNISILFIRSAIMDKVKPLFSISATAVGGRNGHSEANDGSVKVDLSVPKEMGGPGKPNTVTPEHLFAMGYAACFGGAVDFVAKQHKKDASKAKVSCSVSIGRRDAGGFALAVDMRVEDKSLKQAELAELVKEAHEKVCPYSHATRGNIEVKFEIIGG
jgi:osmotically inducible protein OsmC